MEPITRSEQYLASIIGEDVVLPVPQSRIEHYLNLIAQNGISPSSAGLISYDPDADYPDGSLGAGMKAEAAEVNDLKSAINDVRSELDPITIDGYIRIKPADMESGSFTSSGYVDDSTRCRAANHYIKARKGDIVVGHKGTYGILVGITDDPNGTTTVFTSGWRSADFALEMPSDGYYVLLGQCALADFDGEFTVYPAYQNFKGLPEPYYKTEIDATLSAITALQTEPCLCFPLITDIHYGATATSSHPFLFHKTYRNMLEIIKKKRTDAVVCLGDVEDGNFQKANAIAYGQRVNDMLSLLPPKYLLTVGNHDDNRYGTVLTNEEAYSANGAYSDNNVVWNEYDARDYYIDFPKSKIRFISIDSNDNHGYAYSVATVSWFTDIALNTPSGYLAIIMSHLSPISSQNYNNTSVTNGDAISQAIEDYISGGKPAFLLYGHSHSDVSFTSPFLSIGICCNKYTNENGDPSLWPSGAVMPQRTEYTAAEDLWDYVVIRPRSGKVNLVRFGAGQDREFIYDNDTTAKITAYGVVNSWDTTSSSIRQDVKAYGGVTKTYSIPATNILCPAGVIPYTDGTIGNDIGVIAVFNANGEHVGHVSEKIASDTRWSQLATGTLTEYSKSWTFSGQTYVGISFSVDVRYLDDAYMYDKTTGLVFFAGKNTPYYGMSNISEAQ